MKFLHLSDTHILEDYSSTNLNDFFKGGVLPIAKLEKIFESVEFSEFDFLIITGDLTHDGDSNDYSLLFDTVSKYVPSSCPVYYTLGNHDKREAFYRAFFGIECDEEYFYKFEMCGYRCIVLDSCGDSGDDFHISKKQIKWLERELKDDFGNGTLIFFHHPFDWTDNWDGYCVKESDIFLDIVEKSDCLGVFSGHTHKNGTIISKIPQIVTSGVSYGFDFVHSKKIYNEKTGYNICEVIRDKIFVFSEFI